MWIYAVLVLARMTLAKECKDDDCEKRWPGAICRAGRCICPQDSIRRKSDSNGWICLSLIDASTGMLGPPFTCPLPDGAGYRSILYRNRKPVFCQTSIKGNCPKGYECIQSIGFNNAEGNGVCCPRRETACVQPVCESKNGWLIRWYFNGKTCESFRWNPEVRATANNFVTKEHCQSYYLRNRTELINEENGSFLKKIIHITNIIVTLSTTILILWNCGGKEKVKNKKKQGRSLPPMEMGMTENQMHEESSTHIRRSNDKIKLAKKVHKKEMNSEAADKEQKGQRKRKITDNDYSKKNYSSYMDEADDMRKNYRKDQSNIENENGSKQYDLREEKQKRGKKKFNLKYHQKLASSYYGRSSSDSNCQKNFQQRITASKEAKQKGKLETEKSRINQDKLLDRNDLLKDLENIKQKARERYAQEGVSSYDDLHIPEKRDLNEKEKEEEPIEYAPQKELKPKVFAKSEKEKRIAGGKRASRKDYATMDDISSDWDEDSNNKKSASIKRNGRSMKIASSKKLIENKKKKKQRGIGIRRQCEIDGRKQKRSIEKLWDKFDKMRQINDGKRRDIERTQSEESSLKSNAEEPENEEGLSRAVEQTEDDSK